MTAATDFQGAARVRALPRTCVFFALDQERKAFRHNAGPDVRIATSGAGATNAARAASGIIAAYDDTRPTIVVCGFAGSLSPMLKPGNLIVATSVVDLSSGPDSPGQVRTPHSALVDAALKANNSGTAVHRGALVSANRVLITAHEKQEWRRMASAVAVDMETAAIAAVAESAGCPWVSVRAISDGAQTDLPLDFNDLADPDGTVRPGKVALAALLRPWAIPGLMRLGKESATAGRNLASFLEFFLRNVPEIVE